MKRNRIIYAIGIFIVIFLGLLSRSGTVFLPAAVKEYAGDTLWALVAYLMIGFLFPRLSIKNVAFSAALFSLAVELSQLYHAPWIDRIRELRFARLLFGYGFLWSDLVCYGAGIAIGVFLEWSGALRLFSKNGGRSKRPKKP